MIELIKKLRTKGLTYETSQAVYYDVTKFKNMENYLAKRLKKKFKLLEKILMLILKKNIQPTLLFGLKELVVLLIIPCIGLPLGRRISRLAY